MPWPYKQRGEERLSSTFFDWAKDNLQKNASNPDAFIAEVPSLVGHILSQVVLHVGPFSNDVRREGEGGGYPNSDTVREVA